MNAGNYAGDLGADEEAEDDDEQSSEEAKTEARVAPNYGKIAKAIADAQLSGVNIELPDINEAQVDFVPDIARNSILYSLQAVNVVGVDLLDRILKNRPYASVEDFIDKVAPTQVQMIGLIKAGCFDRLCGVPRTQILYRYLHRLAEEAFPLKDKLTTVQVRKALELGLEFPDYKNEIRLFRFKQYISKNRLDKNTKRYVFTADDDACIKFFNTFVAPHMNLSKSEYEFLPNGSIAVKQTAFERAYTKLIEQLMVYVNTPEGRKAYQELLQNDFIHSMQEKYCTGSLSSWEFETMCFYHSGHELAGMNESIYGTRNFESLPEIPENKKLCTIAGTVTDCNNTKHIVSVLTKYGIVDVKFYASAYAQFNQKISVVDPETKKKTVVDDSWFKRGNKILVFGQRRENMFCARSDRSSGFAPRMVGLIGGVRPDGSLDIRYARTKK